MVPSEGCQPEMDPSSLTNKNRSPWNPEPPLKACPVTLPASGMVTPVGEGNDSFVATFEFGSTEYRVETPAPLSEIQNGPRSRCGNTPRIDQLLVGGVGRHG